MPSPRTGIAALALMAACAGCSTAVVRDAPRPVAVGGGAMLEMGPVAEALLGIRGTVVQAVSGSWKDNAFSAEFVMKGDGERLAIAVLAPAMRLATISLSRPHSLRYERARRIPAAFEPEYVLFDLAVVNLDADALSRALGPVFAVSDDGITRDVSLRAPAGGPDGPLPVATLVRRPDGSMKFTSHRHSYEYTVTPLRQ